MRFKHGPKVRARRFIDQTPTATPTAGFELLPEGDGLVADHPVLGWDVEPGDILAFHLRALNGAPGTRSRPASGR